MCASFLVSCPSQPLITQPQQPRFSLNTYQECGSNALVPGTKTDLCGEKGQLCQRFHDRKSGLAFCMPADAQFEKLAQLAEHDMLTFEAQMKLLNRGITVLVRQDRLPPDMPQEGLAGPWLMRYAEAYIQSRGIHLQKTQRQILHQKRSQFLQADSAVWAAFPLSDRGRDSWEEILVLARKPLTRYVISIRIDAEQRLNQPENLRKFLLLFLSQLRIGLDKNDIFHK